MGFKDGDRRGKVDLEVREVCWQLIKDLMIILLDDRDVYS